MLVLLPPAGLGEAGSEKMLDEVLAPKEPGDPKDVLLLFMPLTLCERGLPMGENWESAPAKLGGRGLVMSPPRPSRGEPG